jgi:hypothetical protein
MDMTFKRVAGIAYFLNVQISVPLVMFRPTFVDWHINDSISVLSSHAKELAMDAVGKHF